MNGVKVPFVRTYYGPIGNPYKNHYVLEQGINWLEETRLKIEPKFIKLSGASIKNRFVKEQYEVITKEKNFYKNNLENQRKYKTRVLYFCFFLILIFAFCLPLFYKFKVNTHDYNSLSKIEICLEKKKIIYKYMINNV